MASERGHDLQPVGTGSLTLFTVRQVKIWDDSQDKAIGWLTFKQEVKGVKMRRDM